MKYQKATVALIFTWILALTLVTTAYAQSDSEAGTGLCCLSLLGIFFAVSVITIILALFNRSPKAKPPTYAQKLAESGIITPGEDVIETVEGAEIKQFRKDPKLIQYNRNGTLVLTSKRLLFAQKPAGVNTKGLSLLFYCPLKDILSVTTSGRGSNQLNVEVQRPDTPETAAFISKNAEPFAKKIVENKNKIAEQQTIEAKTIIIEQTKKDNAQEILKKRLAKGEITKEEFHDKIQRM